jgi:ABC-type nickel/cobalt efflux system permease component RcnA
VLLWAFAAYFGYDIVTDAEAYQKYPLFNQGGFALLSVLAIYFTWSAIKEKRAGSPD